MKLSSFVSALCFNLSYFVTTTHMVSKCSIRGRRKNIPRKCLVRYLRIWTREVFRLLAKYTGITYKVYGVEYYNGNGPVIIAANHQSVWDTMVFHILAKDPAYVMKKELMKIPFFGSSAELVGMIPVDRSGKGFRKVLSDSKRAANRKQTIIIFPEGTRVKPCERKEYGCGIYAIYKSTGLKVIPTSLNSGLYWPARKWFSYKPGTISVRYHKAIPPGLRKEEFMTLLRERIEEK